ncbi:MAG: tRNA-dihydrouridine synthase family protein [Spirochaetaceae bacterium]|jgi:tRNA-dihydrouridine synthase|nr:tRNA-dihydrouridine synthase family protein [Spirochaetaceae bacterium]
MDDRPSVKLFLAPMATLSHEALRRSVERFGGCDEYYTEMIHAPSLVAGGRFESCYLRRGPAPEKLRWQLTGNRADSLARAARLVSRLGGAGVDLNMGCSAPEIYRSGGGIAWMLKPRGETLGMVRQVRQALDGSPGGKLPLSVKLRLGDESFGEDDFFDFCDALAAEGVERIVLHPRTRREKYRKAPRWEAVGRLAEHAAGRFTVVLNGAVSDRGSLLAALGAAPGIEAVMVGRAAAQMPWVFRDLRAVLDGSPEPLPRIDLLQTALAFLTDLEECQPEEFWPTRRRRFFEYFCANVAFRHYLFTKIRGAKTNGEARDALVEYFEKSPGERYAGAR